MNKLDFLRRLDRELSALDQTERRELLAFYEERFYNGTIYENKTEEQVVAELESPDVIARNILSEYGISAKEAKQYIPSFRKQRSERRETQDINNYQDEPRKPNPHKINTGNLVGLIIVDLLILSWAIPTLFSVLVSVGGSLLTYFGVLGFLGSDIVYDQMIFWFLTGVYVWLFLFTLAILEFFIWTVRKTVIWHMKVFRYSKVNDWNKKLSKYSVEGWFKRHKFLRFIKNISGVAALLVMAYTGFFLFDSYDEIRELYIEQDVLTSVDSIDIEEDTTALESWGIIGDIESMNIEVKQTYGDEIIITRTYLEGSSAVYNVSFDETNNIISISHDTPNEIFNFGFSIEKIFSFIKTDTLVIEVPIGMLVDVVDIDASNGTVLIDGIDLEEVIINGGNGRITLNDMEISGDANIESSNAAMEVKHVTGNGELYVKTSNGKITISNTAFQTYELRTSNGKIVLSQLNVDDKDGVTLEAQSSNGALEFTGVYVAKVTANTSNGDIDFHNEDLSFIIDYDGHTSNGSESVNVD